MRVSEAVRVGTRRFGDRKLQLRRIYAGSNNGSLISYGFPCIYWHAETRLSEEKHTAPRAVNILIPTITYIFNPAGSDWRWYAFGLVEWHGNFRCIRNCLRLAAAAGARQCPDAVLCTVGPRSGKAMGMVL